VISGEPGVMTPPNRDRTKCDGGRKRAIDLDGMRKAAAEKARSTYAGWLAAVEGTPAARPWREFVDLVGKVEDYTIDQAREEYRTQPRLQALNGTDFGLMFDCPIEEYQKPQKQFIEIARARAVPGYAVLTLDGKWMAPGRVGMF